MIRFPYLIGGYKMGSYSISVDTPLDELLAEHDEIYNEHKSLEDLQKLLQYPLKGEKNLVNHSPNTMELYE